MEELKDGCAAILGYVVVILFVAFFGHALCFACGWLGGLVLRYIFGDAITSVLPIAKETIPIWCGIFSVVGGMMKTNVTANRNKKG